MLIPAFQLHLNNSILEGLSSVGKYDGVHPNLTCATSGGKVFIHNPHDPSLDANQIKFLNINKKISAMTSGALDPKQKRDILMVGTSTNLMAYDVEANRDLFYRDVPEGINCMAFGRVGSVDEPLAIVGGNCTIQGFNSESDERFWTVTGDNVSSLALIDVDEDGQNELLVGSDDYAIRIFQNEEVISETTESDRVIDLCGLRHTKYGYAAANGTVGVYDKSSRVWRAKSKHNVSVISGFDLDGDGVPELIAGFRNGRIEVRSDKNGEVIYRDHFGSAVADIVKADYRLDGREEIICCSADGEVRGYLPAEGELRGGAGGNLMIDAKIEEETLRELNQRKHELLYELKNFEENVRKAKAGEAAQVGLIPVSTKVTCALQPNAAGSCVDLVLTTNNHTIIKSVVVTAENIFDGAESRTVVEKDPSSTLRFPIRPSKDVGTELKIQALVGLKMGGEQYHVFELTHKLPKFAMYVPVKSLDASSGNGGDARSSVTFRVSERINRIILWLNQSFNINVESNDKVNALDVCFVNLRNGGHPAPLRIALTPDHGGQMRIRVDDMEVAGEIIQDLCGFLQVSELESVADFPREMENFKQLLQRVDEFNAVRLKMTAEMADSSQLVKMLVIKAEDARILGNMALMKKMYSQLYEVNRDLIGEYIKRSTNHTELLAALKEVNQVIQKAARLRMGSAKTKVVTDCRSAIKSNNIADLFQVIKNGHA